jgi:hypothetical protein
MKSSAFDRRISKLVNNDDGSERAECIKLCNDPFRLHGMLLSTYLVSWRWYFRDLGDMFSKEVKL